MPRPVEANNHPTGRCKRWEYDVSCSVRVKADESCGRVRLHRIGYVGPYLAIPAALGCYSVHSWPSPTQLNHESREEPQYTHFLLHRRGRP